MICVRLGTRTRGLGGFCAAVALALTLAACGSSSSSSSSSNSASSGGSASASSSASTTGSSSTANVVAAKAVVTKLEQPVPFKVPALGAHPPAGKSVIVITCTLPICMTDVGKGVEKLGWKYDDIEFDTSKGPQAYVAAWEQALQRKPNYILTVGIFPPTLITKQLAQARSDGIGVIGVVGESNNPAFKSCVNCSYYLGQVGVKLADLAISRGATASSTVSLGDPTNIGTGQSEAGINSEYARLHAGGKPPLLSLSLEHAPPQNDAAVVNYIHAHSGINTVINTLSDLSVGLPEALKQAGLSTKVTYYVSAPQVADIADVKNGEEGPALAIMNNSAWWNALDQAVKLSAGKPATQNAGGWLAIMTKDNADAMIAAGGSSRPEPPHYEQEYLSSWGVG